VRAEQFVGFLRHGGQAVAWTFEQCRESAVGSGNARPERMFLCWVQQQAAIEGAFRPGRADKTVPVQNVGCSPCLQAFGLASTVESGTECASGSLTCGNHKTALT